MKNEVLVSVYTIDGFKKRHFKMAKVEETENLLVFHAFEPPIYYESKKEAAVYPHDVTMIARPNWWFSLMVCKSNAGSINHVYANVNTPYEFVGDQFSYIDLDIDVLIKPDYSIEILDEDEFMENIKDGQYKDDWVNNVWLAVKHITEMVNSREEPFNWR